MGAALRKSRIQFQWVVFSRMFLSLVAGLGGTMVLNAEL
jgi:hypothetical protein